MAKGTLLLASSGKEFTKPANILASSAEVKKARKDAMSRLGLDFLDAVGGADEDGMDWEQELAGDEAPATDLEDIKQEVKQEDTLVSPIDPEAPSKESSPPVRPKSATPASTPGPPTTPPAEQDLTQLSARERNRLKRKRKPGNSAFVAAPPPAPRGSKYAAAPAGQAGTKYVNLRYASCIANNILSELA
jgi:TATA-binding protein-associated factor